MNSTSTNKTNSTQNTTISPSNTTKINATSSNNTNSTENITDPKQPVTNQQDIIISDSDILL